MCFIWNTNLGRLRHLRHLGQRWWKILGGSAGVLISWASWWHFHILSHIFTLSFMWVIQRYTKTLFLQPETQEPRHIAGFQLHLLQSGGYNHWFPAKKWGCGMIQLAKLGKELVSGCLNRGWTELGLNYVLTCCWFAFLEMGCHLYPESFEACISWCTICIHMYSFPLNFGQVSTMHRADTDRIDQTRPPLVFVMVAASPSICRSMISTYFDFSLSICINQVCAFPGFQTW